MLLPLSYSLRNLAARPARSIMTAGVIALVVVACSLFLGLISSLKRTLVSTGDPLNLVVMRKGSDNDGSSQLPLEAYQAIRYFDGIARDDADQPLVSPELVVQPFFRTRDGGRENVLVRGVEPVALAVHAQVRITEGRMFTPSAHEAIVGRGVVGRYAGAALGSDLEFGRGTWQVVGVFDAGGSSFESEVWVDVRELANDAKRIFPYSGIRLRATGPAAMAALAQRIDDDPRYAIEAQAGDRTTTPSSDESANSLYILVVGIAVLVGHRRRVRRSQHDVCRGAGPHGRDRHAARARVLARGDPHGVPDRSHRPVGARLRARCGRGGGAVGSAASLCSAASPSARRRSRPTSSRCASGRVISWPRWGSRRSSALAAASARPGARRACVPSRRCARRSGPAAGAGQRGPIPRRSGWDVHGWDVQLAMAHLMP